ncbi:MAG: 6-pyruvoyl trahydropterin synthase family protein [Pseudomonadota bacterium]
MKTQIHLRKENLKFSSAHMTVFPDGTKEALHGHNYQVELTLQLKDSSFKKMVSFSVFKEALKTLVKDWDEKVLIAEKNPFYEEVSRSKKEIEFKVCKKRYVLPMDEVEFLPIENISSEALAECLLKGWVKEVGEGKLKNWTERVVLRVDESPGQGASVELGF